MKLKLFVAAVVSIAVGCFVPCVVGFAGTVKVLGSLARVSIALLECLVFGLAFRIGMKSLPAFGETIRMLRCSG